MNEIARRKLYLELGCSSLYDYCVRRLRYSGSSACRRIRAARCIREHPDVLALLESGDLDLGTIYLIEPVLSEENAFALLARVQGKSYRDVKRVVAEYAPPVVVEERIEPVRAFVAPSDIDGVLFERDCARRGFYPRTPGDGSWVVSAQKVAVQFLASEELMAKYEEAKALSRTAGRMPPSPRCWRCCSASTWSATARRRGRSGARRDGPRRSNQPAQVVSSRPPAPVVIASVRILARDMSRPRRDEVFIRDGGRCTYVAPGGTRCESTHALQIDHNARPVEPSSPVRRAQPPGRGTDVGQTRHGALLAAGVGRQGGSRMRSLAMALIFMCALSTGVALAAKVIHVSNELPEGGSMELFNGTMHLVKTLEIGGDEDDNAPILAQVSDIVVDGGRIYVAERAQDMVVVYDHRGLPVGR